MTLTNVIWDEIAVGAEASLTRVCSANDLYVFAHASGNINPIHLPSTGQPGGGKRQADVVAPSMWVGALASAVIGTILPGPGTLYRGQTFRFADRVHVGDTLKVSVRVIEKRAKPIVLLETRIVNQSGVLIAEGVAEVDAPVTRLRFEEHPIPSLIVNRHVHFDRMIEEARNFDALPTAVIAPDDKNSLSGALLARDAGLIKPIFLGSRARIMAAAAELHMSIAGIPLIDIDDEHLAAARGVAMVHTGEVRCVMKGHIHSDHLLEHVVKKDGGLRSGRRISHTFVMDVPGRDTPLFITDAAINILPDLMTKVDITQNAIDLARACGLEKPRVGILSAVETVNPSIQSSVDAAVIAKMADRGQITGGIVDGPLAMDNAIDVDAARTKGITSLVAGHAEVLVCPNLESGNMLAKELTFIAHAEAAGLVLGAKVPVILTSRADNDKARLASSALAVLYDHWKRTGRSFREELRAAAE